METAKQLCTDGTARLSTPATGPIMLDRATHISCSLCTFRSGWTAYSAQSQRSGCNITIL